jgi:pimeloyl-ACP methyl ester carboxylesterase
VPVTRTPDGVDIAWYDLAAEVGAGAGGRPVVLCHATGFHGHVWLPVAERLGAAGYHCYSFDQRGHGDSGRPVDGNFAWSGFATDVLAVIDAAGLASAGERQRPLAAGWSCGGALLLLAEQRVPGTFGSLYLFEPVVPPMELPPDMPSQNPLAAGARRRREVFPSRQAAYDNYASKPPLQRAAAAALHAYVDFGFDDLPDGTVRLKCRGEDEAAVYDNGMRHDAFANLPSVACPVTVSCGSDTDAFGPDAIAAVVERLPHGRAEVLPGLTHFAPVEDPAALASRIIAAFTAA